MVLLLETERISWNDQKTFVINCIVFKHKNNDHITRQFHTVMDVNVSSIGENTTFLPEKWNDNLSES